LIGLTYIRNLYNESLDDIGKILGVSKQSVHQWEMGLRPIPDERLKQLGEIFNLKEQYFNKELTNNDKIYILEQEIIRLKFIKMHDISGKSFNNFKVLKYVKKDTKGRTFWKCLCNCCGNMVIIRSDNLKNGNSTKCIKCGKIGRTWKCK